MATDILNPLKWYVRCRCPDRCHLLVLEYSDDNGLVWSTQSDVERGSLWQRIKKVFRYLRGKKELCWNDALIDQQGAEAIQSWLLAAKQGGYGTDWH